MVTQTPPYVCRPISSTGCGMMGQLALHLHGVFMSSGSTQGNKVGLSLGMHSPRWLFFKPDCGKGSWKEGGSVCPPHTEEASRKRHRGARLQAGDPCTINMCQLKTFLKAGVLLIPCPQGAKLCFDHLLLRCECPLGPEGSMGPTDR
jgi:hypothetical protein